MVDITKCSNGDNCKLKDNCLRWTAQDDDWQSCCEFYAKGVDCEYYVRYKGVINEVLQSK